MPLYVCNGTTGTQRCRCTPATGPLARSDAVVRLQRDHWHAAMPLYACNGAADTQRCRCTSATGPLARSVPLYVCNGAAGAQRSCCTRTTAFSAKFFRNLRPFHPKNAYFWENKHSTDETTDKIFPPTAARRPGGRRFQLLRFAPARKSNPSGRFQGAQGTLATLRRATDARRQHLPLQCRRTLAWRPASDGRTDEARGGLLRLCNDYLPGSLWQAARAFGCRHAEA